MTSTTLDDLRDDLNKAYEKGAVAFYHIGKGARVAAIAELFYEEEYFDVYVALTSKHMPKEDVLKTYLRNKYGHLIRVLAVELYG